MPVLCSRYKCVVAASSHHRHVLAQWKANVQFLKWEQSVIEEADDHFGLAIVRKVKVIRVLLASDYRLFLE